MDLTNGLVTSILSESDYESKLKTRLLFESSFEEEKLEFIDYYYSVIIKRSTVITLHKKNKLISMLVLHPYLYKICDSDKIVYYIESVATDKKYRKYGYAKLIINEAIRYLKSIKCPFCFLMPANDKLMDYYKKIGFDYLCDFTYDKFNDGKYDIFPVRTAEFELLMEMENYFLEKESNEYKNSLKKKKILFYIIDESELGLSKSELLNLSICVCQEV